MIKHRLVFGAACLGMLLFGIVMITLGSTLPELMTRYQLNEVQTGSMFSVLPLGILAGSLVFGPIADRYGYKGLLISNVLLIMIGLEGIAYGHQASLLMLSVFIIGFSGGVLNGATNALVADISELSKGAHLSLLGVFYGVGALSMPTLINMLKNQFTAPQIISGVGWSIVIVIIFFAIIRFPKPKHNQGFSLNQAIQLVKSKSLLLAGFLLFFASGNEGITNNWLTTYLENHQSLIRTQALFSLSALVLSLTATRVILGKALKVYPDRNVFYVSLIFQALGVVALSFGQGYVVMLLGAILVGMGMAAIFPIILGFVAELFVQWSGIAFSIVLAIALTGNILINYAMGFLIQWNGISMLLYAQGLCILCMLGLLMALLKFNKNKLKN